MKMNRNQRLKNIAQEFTTTEGELKKAQEVPISLEKWGALMVFNERSMAGVDKPTCGFDMI
jgi:hypothetical protein